MDSQLLGLYELALGTAMILVLPAIGVIAAIGIIVGLAQALVGIQDQNLSFGPKIGAVALLAAVCGLQALSVIASLLQTAVNVLPRLTR